MFKLSKLFQNIKIISVLCAMMLLLASCQSATSKEESAGTEGESSIEANTSEESSEMESSTEESFEIESSTEETTEAQLGFQGRVIPSVYEDYYMYWDDICVLIITYTGYFEGSPEFGLIGYNGTENPVFFMGNTAGGGYGEYYMYCFKDNRVYKSNETIKGKLHFNRTTKEFATQSKNGVWDIYTYYSNHIIWLRQENTTPEGFEPMTLTYKHCSPAPMVENIRSFIIW